MMTTKINCTKTGQKKLSMKKSLLKKLMKVYYHTIDDDGKDVQLYHQNLKDFNRGKII